MKIDNRSDLHTQIKSMNSEELHSYNRVILTLNRLFDISGISVLLLMINFPNIIIAIPGSIILYIAAEISVQLNITHKFVKEQIAKHKDTINS